MKPLHQSKPRVVFARDNQLFRRACQLAGLSPSRHQAKRWLRHEGTAWAMMDDARCEMSREEAAVRFP